MNCAKHTEVPATAFCRTCGKALCGDCTRDVRGVIYCEGCIADRLSGTLPTGTPAAMPVDNVSPGLAALLGFIPGVGAVYNGQAGKGFLHLIAFVTLIAISNEVGPITVPIWFFFVGYMVVDAPQNGEGPEVWTATAGLVWTEQRVWTFDTKSSGTSSGDLRSAESECVPGGRSAGRTARVLRAASGASAWIEPAGRGDHPDRARVPVPAAKRWDVPVPLDRQTVATDPDSCGSEHVPAP